MKGYLNRKRRDFHAENLQIRFNTGDVNIYEPSRYDIETESVIENKIEVTVSVGSSNSDKKHVRLLPKSIRDARDLYRIESRKVDDKIAELIEQGLKEEANKVRLSRKGIVAWRYRSKLFDDLEEIIERKIMKLLRETDKEAGRIIRDETRVMLSKY